MLLSKEDHSVSCCACSMTIQKLRIECVFCQWKCCGRIMCLQGDLTPFAKKRSWSSTSHACKYSLAEKEIVIPSSQLWELLPQLAVNPVTTLWAKEPAKFGSRKHNRGQGSVTSQNESEIPWLEEVVYSLGFKSTRTSCGQWSAAVGVFVLLTTTTHICRELHS